MKTGLHVQEGHGSVLMFLSDTHIIMQKQQNITQTRTIMKKEKKKQEQARKTQPIHHIILSSQIYKYKVMTIEKN